MTTQSSPTPDVAAAPQDAPDLTPYMGIYQLHDGSELMIGIAPTSDQLAYYDPATGRIGALFPTQADEFTCGPALFVPEPAEAQFAFVRDERHAISAVFWQRGELPAEYAQKIKLDHEEVRFHNGDVTLAGTLIKPPTAGPHPAIVMIHGSGPQGRPNMRPVADFLARLGIAVLLYDKRGVGASTGDWTHSTFADLVEDALAGLRLLRTRPDIRAEQVGFWGRSQGGWLGPLAASRSNDVAFVISVVGPAVSVFQQDLDRVEYQLRADGFAEEDIAAALAYVELVITVVRSGQGWPQLKALTDQSRSAAWAAYVSQPKAEEELSWWRENDYDPMPVLQSLTCPILALFGERDTLVPVATNKALMERALSGNPDHMIAVLPSANHYSLVAQTGGTREIPQLNRFVTEYYTIMADWLGKRVALLHRAPVAADQQAI
jgi:pimeloyl-ACP methyl ester carboxylesterase